MTKEEYSKALALLLDNKYDYLTGKKAAPQEVVQLLVGYYLWPWDCETCATYDNEMTSDRRLEYMNSHIEVPGAPPAPETPPQKSLITRVSIAEAQQEYGLTDGGSIT